MTKIYSQNKRVTQYHAQYTTVHILLYYDQIIIVN